MVETHGTIEPTEKLPAWDASLLEIDKRRRAREAMEAKPSHHVVGVRLTGEQAVAKLPASIRVGPFDYAIEKMPPLEAHCRGVYGECSNRELKIRMSGGGFPDAVKAADTLLHELSHAIWFSFGIEDDDKQERTVNLMSTAWTGVYRANPLAARLAGGVSSLTLLLRVRR